MKKLLFTTILLCITFLLHAQLGTSSGSYSYVRPAAGTLMELKQSDARGNASVQYKSLPQENSIIVEDFINYHKHNIAIPKTANVALSIDYDNSAFNDEDEFLLQIGIASQPAEYRKEKQLQVNIALVLDLSTSMRGPKIENLKTATKQFISSLNNGDLLSIVTFSTDGKVMLPATEMTSERERLYAMIDELYASGMTNLNEGMVLGYKELAKRHTRDTNSRVIMLTDGQTNQGETSHSKIINNSTKYNDKGIELTTIGIGSSLDFNLLRDLADKGNGSNYFIGEAEEDINKVFGEELQSILYKVGTNQQLAIELPNNWSVEKCYGYESKMTRKGNNLNFKLENLGANSTRIILLKIRKNESESEDNVLATLNYTANGIVHTVKKEREYSDRLETTNIELPKNYEIAFMAQSLKDASKKQYAGNARQGQDQVNQVAQSMKMSKNYNDEDFQRMYKIVDSYTVATICE